MAKRKTKSQTAQPKKFKNRPKIFGCRGRATYRWKALDENYNFALEYISI